MGYETIEWTEKYSSNIEVRYLTIKLVPVLWIHVLYYITKNLLINSNVTGEDNDFWKENTVYVNWKVTDDESGLDYCEWAIGNYRAWEGVCQNAIYYLVMVLLVSS